MVERKSKHPSRNGRKERLAARGRVILVIAHSGNADEIVPGGTEPSKHTHTLLGEGQAIEKSWSPLTLVLPTASSTQTVCQSPRWPLTLGPLLPREREPVKATSPVPAQSDGPGLDLGSSQAMATAPSGFGVPYTALPEEVTMPVPSPVTSSNTSN